MKRIIIASVSLIVFASIGVFAIPANSALNSRRQFNDVDPGSQYYNAIEFVRRNSIALGYNDGSFRPYNATSRAQFVAMVAKARGITPSTSTYRNCFFDVANEWFANEVCYARERSWLFSTDQYFRPNLSISFNEAKVVIEKAFGKSLPASYSNYSQNITRAVAAQMIYDMMGGTPATYDPYYGSGKYCTNCGGVNYEVYDYNGYADDGYYYDTGRVAPRYTPYAYDDYTSTNAAPLPVYRPRYAKVPPSGRVYVPPEPRVISYDYNNYYPYDYTAYYVDDMYADGIYVPPPPPYSYTYTEEVRSTLPAGYPVY